MSTVRSIRDFLIFNFAIVCYVITIQPIRMNVTLCFKRGLEMESLVSDFKLKPNNTSGSHTQSECLSKINKTQCMIKLLLIVYTFSPIAEHIH